MDAKKLQEIRESLAAAVKKTHTVGLDGKNPFKTECRCPVCRPDLSTK